MERPAGSRLLRLNLEGDEDYLLRVLPSQPTHLHQPLTPLNHNEQLLSSFPPIITADGELELEDLAAMLETTVDYIMMEFLL